jgi:hypothetical protein
MVPFVGPPLVWWSISGVPSGLPSSASVKSNPYRWIVSVVVLLNTVSSSRRIVYWSHRDNQCLSTATPGVPESQTWIVITSVPKKFGFGVYTYVPSGLITIAFVGPLTGVVVTTNGVPSGSISPWPVKSPPTVGLSLL